MTKPSGNDRCKRNGSTGSEAAQTTCPCRMVVASNRSSKAFFFTYTLFAEYDRLPNDNGRRFWRARVLNCRGVRVNFPGAAGWASQAEAEQHAENIARHSAKQKGVLLPDEKPKWRLI